MPRLIVKFRYWENASCRHPRSANYMKYIATREGVDKLDDAWRSRKATVQQTALIGKITKRFPKLKESDEYREYEKLPSRGSASELIGFALDEYPALLDNDKTYLDYMATRPRAEKLGMHGLFSDDGKTLDLAEESRKITTFNGRVHTLIISLSREDAENTGFNNAERWRAFMRVQKSELSKRYDIPMESLQWFGAFHNESYHPHIHVMLYSTDPSHKGYITQNGLENLKSALATDIFKCELSDIYKEQTKRRDELTAFVREETAELVMNINSGICTNPKLAQKMLELSEKIKGTTGKKVYGYMPPQVKNLINEITDMLTKDERIKRLYDLWYESKYQIMRSYTDHLPTQKPLSQEEAFKPIKNAILHEAMNLKAEIHASEESAEQSNYSDSNNTTGDDTSSHKNSGGADERKSSAPLSASTHKKQIPHSHKKVVAMSSVTRLLKDASRIFDDRINDELHAAPDDGIDSRLRREIEAKKKGQNLSM